MVALLAGVYGVKDITHLACVAQSMYQDQQDTQYCKIQRWLRTGEP